MTAHSAPPVSRQEYAEFLTQLSSMLKTVLVPATQVGELIKLTTLPGIENPVESLQVSVQFTGALCLFNFGQSAVVPDLYFLDVELQRPKQPALFLKDYVAQHRLPGADKFRFRLLDQSLAAGIQGQLDMVRTLLNVNLRSVLEGGPWVTAPVDWGDYK